MIRRAGVEDAAGLIPLIREFYDIDGHPYDAERVESGLMPLLRDDRYGHVWIAISDDDSTLGYAVVTWSWSLESGGLDCILDEIYVRARGSGLGGILLEHAADEARAFGAAAMFLETEIPNDGARRFYTRHGFAADNSVWMSRSLALKP
ncbi:GNAT family N-acetyltransferase [Mycolicibacterium iranicum]|uniref:N-acetyltransferase domain-containing protein n=1 Tax=Mycolicibacterium iranicum TaxID=912594 RepID=A0A178M0V2_MYCIR|nr:GNAT family N-acetyltransferase [Mycolicibacterium iranicum]OAN40102.1 hypothetical protein A4X20_15345 [Mycolicibacterium iranicum]